MQKCQKWILAFSMIVALGGWAMVVDKPSYNTAEAKEKVKIEGDHWRNHDGHWSYWNTADKQWYYTDGTHWFYNDGKEWKTYRFDREFGKTGFHKGDYQVPGPDVEITLPQHKIYVHR